MTRDVLEKGLVSAVATARDCLQALLCSSINPERTGITGRRCLTLLYLDVVWGHLGELSVWQKLVFGS